MKNSYILLISLVLLSSNAFARTFAKFTSQDIYSYTDQISKHSKNEIWQGFEPLKFIELKKDSDSQTIRFSPEPNNPESFVFMTLDDSYFADHTLEQNLSITFHEAFHAFQRNPNRAGMKWGYENAMLIFEYQESSARNNALFAVEAKILRDALSINDKKKLQEKVGEFLTIRHLRQSELDEKFVEFEKGAELNEGMADYAGTKGVLLGIELAKSKKLNVPFESLDSKEYLKKRGNLLNSINRLGKNVRIKFYHTGSAQGLLLDRLMPDWKTEIQMNGKAVQDLLEKNVSPKFIQKIEVGKILREYDYENILIEEEKAAQKRQAENLTLLEQTLNEKGRKIIIAFSKLNNLNNIKTFDPMNVTMVKPNVRVHTRVVNFGLKDIFEATFSQPVVEDLNDKKYICVVPEDMNLEIKIKGRKLDLSEESETDFNEKLELVSENVKLEISKGSIKIRNKEITLNIEK